MKTLITAILTALGIHGSLSAEQKHDVVTATVHAVPGGAAAGGAHVAQLPLSDMLVVCSIAFVLLQAGYLIWKWRRDARRDRERQEDRRLGVHSPFDPADDGEPS
ncbi:hypothetical protein [Variovorax sp. PAMC26660]|uniref:hypothetical protein n=1 Tax=Variovorax sp. PAMC26660 TaxID=2762322 RepID=UPI00164DFFA5|nr:hypothetical protein [Variovorax sp. PAMC26660]QNK68447.1 hypothetical protein H7F35_01480 [Variovorax sp. PAMC26660]